MTIVDPWQVALVAREDGMWLCRGVQSRLFGAGGCVVVSTTLPRPSVVDAMSRFAVVGSWGDMASLLERRSSGVPLIPLEPTENESSRVDEVCFSFDTSSCYWSKLASQDTLAIFLPTKLPDPALSISVRTRAGSDLRLSDPAIEPSYDPIRSLYEDVSARRHGRRGDAGMPLDRLLSKGGVERKAGSTESEVELLAAGLRAVRQSPVRHDMLTDLVLDGDMLREVVAARGLVSLEEAGLFPCDLNAARACLEHGTLARMFDSDVCLTDESSVGGAIERYTGMSLEQCEARMRPLALSRDGFLAHGERLTDVITEDARTLQELSITHIDLADRLEAVLLVGTLRKLAGQCAAGESDSHTLGSVRHLQRLMSRYESHAQRLLSSDESHPSPSMLLGALPFEFDVTITLGRQDDPFHLFPISLFCPWGSADFSIRNLRTGATLKGGDLAPWLIRTACFFEGSVPYRIDPRAAVEVLFGGG